MNVHNGHKAGGSLWSLATAMVGRPCYFRGRMVDSSSCSPCAPKENLIIRVMARVRVTALVTTLKSFHLRVAAASHRALAARPAGRPAGAVAGDPRGGGHYVLKLAQSHKCSRDMCPIDTWSFRVSRYGRFITFYNGKHVIF